MSDGRSTSLRFGNKSGKVIPREISESLGKLPPQNLECEDAVLGALMLEAKSFDDVKDILRPDHFYSEQHKEVAQAIYDLHASHEPVDMRTVANQLRKTGKLELVGGLFAIAQLTDKVTSSAHITAHAMPIVEAAMKRGVIEAASNAQMRAYSDESDAIELLESVIEQFKFVKERHISEPSAAKIQAQWKDRLLEVEPEKETPILFIDGVPIGTPGNHSVVNGKKKSRKTLFLVWLICEYLKLPNTHPDDVAFFDTEQGKSHVYAIRDKVFRVTGKKIPVFYMRGMSPIERQEFIEHTITHWENIPGTQGKLKSKKPKLAFIDGIRDLVSNINDIDECTELIVWLEKLILNHNLHVCNVIHQNKSEFDKNARGHIGTELGNKAQTVIELEVDKKAGVTIVKCADSRDKPFDDFAFTHGLNDLPQLVGLPTKDGQVMNETTEHSRIREVFEDGAMGFNDLMERIGVSFKCAKTKAKYLLQEWVREGWVIKEGKAFTKGSVYRLITENFTRMADLHQPPPSDEQPGLFDDSKPINPDDMPF